MKLVAQGLGWKAAGRPIVQGVDLDLAPGETFGLIGPNGSGKSTLLRLIAGLEDVTSGQIIIDGQDMTDAAPAKRKLAMVFQSYALYPHMSVRKNIAFPLKMAGMDATQQEARVRHAAGILNLTDYLDRRPGQLSGGQRQRVAIGRAIVREPSAFLFDEPLSNLDAKLRVAMRTEIKELHQRLKTTSIYVTHDQIEAMTMGDQIVVMKDGRIEQTGSPLQLYDTPANLFVAGFIGSPAMNFLPGTLRRNASGAVVEFGDGSHVPAPPGSGGADGQAVIFGTRPEHLTLVHEGGLTAEVAVVEPTGADTFVSCRHLGKELIVVFHERHAFSPGSSIHLQPDLQRAHLFDAGSGRRLAG